MGSDNQDVRWMVSWGLFRYDGLVRIERCVLTFIAELCFAKRSGVVRLFVISCLGL